MEKMNLIDDIMKVKGKNTMTKDVNSSFHTLYRRKCAPF